MLLCESLENLFKCSLPDRVLWNIIILLHLFYQSEYRPDRLILLRKSDLGIITELLKQINLFKNKAKLVDAVIEVEFAVKTACVCIRSWGLSLIRLYHLFYLIVEFRLGEIDFFGGWNSKFWSDWLNFTLLKRFNLNFNYEACSELVLNVLWASKALENTTLDHNAHFGAECLRFIHAMSSQNNSAGLSLRDTSHYSPHESTGFGIHARWRLI